MIVTDPTGAARTAARAVAGLAGLWLIGWLVFLQGLMAVMVLHSMGVHS